MCIVVSNKLHMCSICEKLDTSIFLIKKKKSRKTVCSQSTNVNELQIVFYIRCGWDIVICR